MSVSLFLYDQHFSLLCWVAAFALLEVKRVQNRVKPRCFFPLSCCGPFGPGFSFLAGSGGVLDCEQFWLLFYAGSAVFQHWADIEQFIQKPNKTRSPVRAEGVPRARVWFGASRAAADVTAVLTLARMAYTVLDGCSAGVEQLLFPASQPDRRLTLQEGVL